MKVASSIISSYSSLTCSHKLNYFLLHHQKLNHNHIRICFSLLSIGDTSSVNNKRPMVTSSTSSSSSNNSSGAFTTLKEKVTFEREIKKSKFIAIAAPVSDERSAHSFLSQVRTFLRLPLYPFSRFFFFFFFLVVDLVIFVAVCFLVLKCNQFYVHK